MIGPRRGRALLAGAVTLAVLLVAGRWLAVETTERAWAATLPHGAVYLDARALARVLRLALWFVATLWGVGNLYVVYRAIGSVQMPRRVGNLEIAEAVPQRVLLLLAVGIGLVFGAGLAWGAGDWWRAAALAGAAPVFGYRDPVLHHDLGYYVGALPWAIARQRFLLLTTLTAVVLVGFLYAAIGSVRWQKGRLITSGHARAHLGVLLAGVALSFLWGALLDPPEIVAGMHGPVGGGLVSMRIPAAPAVAAVAGLAILATFAWAVWDHVRWLAVVWGVLLLGLLTVYMIFPARRRPGTTDPYVRQRVEYTALAFANDPRPELEPPQYASVSDFLAAVALWSPERVAAAARPTLGPHETVAGAALVQDPERGPIWLVARSPDDSALLDAQPPPTWAQVHIGAWTETGPPLAFRESDSGLAAVPLPPGDSVTRFGEGFSQYAVVPAAAAAGTGGIPLDGRWRRLALAWVLQSPELARRAPADRLLWRRSASERFARLAPFAEFDPAAPVLIDGALWWRAEGYVSAAAFPFVEPVAIPGGRSVAYLRAGLVGAVRAATGETRFWLLPDADSLTVAWARLFAPLVAPAESLPPALARTLRYPVRSFTLAVQRLVQAVPDSEGWRALSREPHVFTLPDSGGAWLGQGIESGGGRFELILLGRLGRRGPELWSVSPPAPDLAPQLLVGVGDTIPGPLTLWLVAGHLASAQARFIERHREPPRLERVFLTWGNRGAEGATRSDALRELALAGPPGAADTSLLARWSAARRWFAQLDSALVARDFERFGQAYRRLRELLGARRPLAPAAPRP